MIRIHQHFVHLCIILEKWLKEYPLVQTGQGTLYSAIAVIKMQQEASFTHGYFSKSLWRSESSQPFKKVPLYFVFCYTSPINN